MKTIIFENAPKTFKVTIKVDIFASNTELATEGFDTRFTNMEIVEDEGAVVEGLALTEIEQSWVAIKQFAEAAGYNLSVVDLNEPTPEVILSWTAIAGTVAGTRGLKAIVGTTSNWDPELTAGDIIALNGFVYTVDAVADDNNATILEDLQRTYTTATLYIKD